MRMFNESSLHVCRLVGSALVMLGMMGAASAQPAPAKQLVVAAGESQAQPSADAPRSTSAPANFEGVWQPDFVAPLVEAGEGTNGALTTVERTTLPYSAKGANIFWHRVTMEQRGTPVANSVSQYLPAIPVYQLDLFLGVMNIIQDQDNVVILFEDGTRWHIRLNRGHPKKLAHTYKGDSVGHFEGATLVVESTGFNTKTWLDSVGSPHGKELRFITRITKIRDGQQLEFLTTYDDPEMYLKPFTVRRTASWQADGRLLESEIENLRPENNASLVYED